MHCFKCTNDTQRPTLTSTANKLAPLVLLTQVTKVNVVRSWTLITLSEEFVSVKMNNP